jgi:hypothetical protein
LVWAVSQAVDEAEECGMMLDQPRDRCRLCDSFTDRWPPRGICSTCERMATARQVRGVLDALLNHYAEHGLPAPDDELGA